MTDPYLDPVSLQMSHMHASESEQTEGEKAVRVQWSWPEGVPAAGELKKLRLSIADGNGQMIPAFMVTNEKLLHLIAVSSDLRFFSMFILFIKVRGFLSFRLHSSRVEAISCMPILCRKAWQS